MAIIDYKTSEQNEGEFDIELPLSKITSRDDLLFQQVELLFSTYTEDFAYDETMGIPYEQILRKDFDLTSLETIYYGKIKVLVYFKDFLNFKIDIDSTRNYLISFDVVSENNITQNFNFSLGA